MGLGLGSRLASTATELTPSKTQSLIPASIPSLFLCAQKQNIAEHQVLGCSDRREEFLPPLLENFIEVDGGPQWDAGLFLCP